MNAYERVMAARDSKRNLGAYYIYNILDDFIELHGDRNFADDAAVVGGIGMLNGIPVTAIAMERGNSIEERMKRNFGCPSPEGYRKALRLMKQAEKFRRPVICIINSSGAYCGISAEERGQGEAIAKNLMDMMTLKTPVISVVAGEGGSGGALALSVADKIIMFENAVYSVISPEGCASILWKDAKQAPAAAEALKLTAQDLYDLKITDKIISEDGKTAEQICTNLKNELVNSIKEISAEPDTVILQKRYNKFRKIGTDVFID